MLGGDRVYGYQDGPSLIVLCGGWSSRDQDVLSFIVLGGGRRYGYQDVHSVIILGGGCRYGYQDAPSFILSYYLVGEGGTCTRMFPFS